MVCDGIIRASKGTGKSIVLTVPQGIVEVEGIRVGDMLKIRVENTQVNKEVARRVKVSKMASMTPSPVVQVSE